MLNLVINSQLWPPCEQRNIIPFAFVSCICSEMGVVLYYIWNPWQRTFQPSCGWTVLVHNALPATMLACFSGVGVELTWTSLWCKYCSIVSREQGYVPFLVVSQPQSQVLVFVQLRPTCSFTTSCCCSYSLEACSKKKECWAQLLCPATISYHYILILQLMIPTVLCVHKK